MGRVNRFTPLAQLKAVVVDTETTGLDVASARLVQISAVGFQTGNVLAEQTFDTLINPGVPIPPRSTAIHGVTDAMVADAPTFSAVKATFERFVDGAVLVGQSIGFDLAVLLHETRRVGEEWVAPRFLDTKLLAAALDPESREFGLDALAARFDVAIEDRHNALGDALVTARVFERMLPVLAAAGIHTLADAEAHSNAQTRIRARQLAEGWYDPTSFRATDVYESGREAAALERLDTFLYRHRLHHVMMRPVFVPPATSLLDAVRLMVERQLPVVLAGDADAARADGIISQTDVLRVVASGDGTGLLGRVEHVMNEPVATLPREAFLYRALARMQRLGVQHLAVTDSGQRVVGMVSLRDLVANHAADALVLGDELAGARTPHDLAVGYAKLASVTRHLLADGVDAHEISLVASVEMHELLGRAAAQAERHMESQGDGRPPVPYAVLALGRSGRSECLLAPETDHAIVFESGAPDGSEDRWFAAFAAHLAAVLAEAGMASAVAAATQAAWRRSLEAWRVEVAQWAAAGPADPTAPMLFFDFAFVFGDADLAADLRELSVDLAARSPSLIAAMLPGAGTPIPAAQRVDIHVAGLAPIEAAARSLALATGTSARGTVLRLAEAVSRTGLAQAAADDLIETHQRLMRAVIAQQHVDVANGVAPSFAVDVDRLATGGRAELTAALQHASGVEALVRAALAAV